MWVGCTASAWDSEIVALVGCGGRKAVRQQAFSSPQEGPSSVSLPFLPHSQILQFITQSELKTSCARVTPGLRANQRKEMHIKDTWERRNRGKPPLSIFYSLCVIKCSSCKSQHTNVKAESRAVIDIDTEDLCSVKGSLKNHLFLTFSYVPVAQR